MTREYLLNKIHAKYPDAIDNYTSDKYDFKEDPATCYIPSRDLYIEIINVSPHFWCEDFDESLHPEGDECITQSDEYMNEMMLMSYKADEENKKIIEDMIHYWIVDMSNKRNAARASNLNYVVFWDTKLQDAVLWFGMGCPDGHDWEREYSWLPDPQRDIDIYPLYKFTGKPMNLSKIVKHFQFFEFYWRELSMWYNNDAFKNRGLLQGYLYSNRYQYIGKLPNELSDAEILRGLTISGVLRGYTTFDAKLMYEAIDKYQPTSIFDPCAGWGERMLACYTKNVAYLGVDVNIGLETGYRNMINFYNMTKQNFVIGDSAEYDSSNNNHDMVLTCPPYGGIEYYTDDGAENLDDNGFLNWWKAVVEKSVACGPKHFCFQINNRYRDDMLKIVEDAGYKLVDELFFKSNKSSHFNRKKNGVNLKTEKESMLVLEKI